MAHSKHESSLTDLDQPYEQNVVGIKGIVYFAVGLFMLIVITFGLMYALWGVFEQDAIQTKSSDNLLRMSDKERLPPEPRLQLAPGFEIQGPQGSVNLELREPQAEYRELRKIWDEMIKNGGKDPETGALVSMPVDQAIDMFLEQPVKAKTGPDAEKTAVESKLYYTDASSGRVATVRRR